MKTRLLEAMEMAGQNLLNVLSPAYEYMPCWNLWIERDLKASCNFGGISPEDIKLFAVYVMENFSCMH